MLFPQAATRVSRTPPATPPAEAKAEPERCGPQLAWLDRLLCIEPSAAAAERALSRQADALSRLLGADERASLRAEETRWRGRLETRCRGSADAARCVEAALSERRVHYAQRIAERRVPPPPVQQLPPRRSMAAPAVPLNAPSTWVIVADYPKSAVTEGRGGTSIVRFEILANGSIGRCYVHKSSGHGDLDQAHCSAVRRRARYSPARDFDGRPVVTEAEHDITWRPR